MQNQVFNNWTFSIGETWHDVQALHKLIQTRRDGEVFDHQCFSHFVADFANPLEINEGIPGNSTGVEEDEVGKETIVVDVLSLDEINAAVVQADLIGKLVRDERFSPVLLIKRDLLHVAAYEC